MGANKMNLHTKELSCVEDCGENHVKIAKHVIMKAPPKRKARLLKASDKDNKSGNNNRQSGGSGNNNKQSGSGNNNKASGGNQKNPMGGNQKNPNSPTKKTK